MVAFVLAHISDPHLAPLPRPQLRDLIGKRAIGYINWTRNRHTLHRREVLDALVADLHAQRPDHIAVTGDLVNIALPQEIAQAADWLRSVGDGAQVTLVPGNHDAYVGSAMALWPRAWGAYMSGDNAAPHATAFPFVRQRGPLTLIGISSAVPTAPFRATGTLGQAQIEALDRILRDLAGTQTFRVLLVHHPLRSDAKRRHARLIDSDPLLDLLHRYGVDLVLHGHDHRHAVITVAGPARLIPVVGVASASMTPHGHRPAAAYHLISIDHVDGDWRVVMTTRAVSKEGGVSEVSREVLR